MMNFRSRFALFSTIWLIIILLLFNIFIYFYFDNLSTRSELQLMRDKASTILNVKNIDQKSQWDRPNLLSEFLVASEMIRIVGIDGAVKNSVYSDPELAEVPPKQSLKSGSNSFTKDKVKYVFVQTPIYNAAHIQVGTLEIGHKLMRLQYYLDVLLNALIVSSLCAVMLSLLGSYFYTALLVRPIYSFVKTMRENQKSGEFRKIETKGSRKDELNVLATAFNSMMDRLKQNFSRQKQFVADASHELKTPLTIIESYISLLRRWGKDDPQIQEEAIEAIHSEAIRLKELTKSLLQLADLEHEEWVIREWVDIVTLASETAVMMEQAFGRVIELRSDQTNLYVSGDVAKLKQVFIILIDNAIKYSTEPIHIEIQEHQRYCKVKIIDKGIGIDAEEIPFLFERFYRVDKARARTTGGVGLGLSIAKGIVELHGGYIEVYSEKQVGTTMVINIPK
ncbi:sensor histidine kinase [Paenibacillus gansuensis]|uniref:histidine kinase n=1 Tax=Paenibacillus gansuensis TaxID=306542 RepID=A0ABW5PAA2_9BACL